MNKKAFADLVSSVRDMGRHMRGEKVVGARVTKVRKLGGRMPKKTRTFLRNCGAA